MRIVLRIAFLLAALAGGVAASSAGDLSATFRYRLANFGGPIAMYPSRIRVDAPRNEAWVLQGNFIRAFNPSGMETFSFTLDPALGFTRDIAVQPNGDLLLLVVRSGQPAGGPAFFVQRCNYRGEPTAQIVPALPQDLAGFEPTAMEQRGDVLYLVSSAQLKVVALKVDGSFVSQLDLAQALEVKPEEVQDWEVGGFTIDPQGDLLFTIPSKFLVATVNKDGQVGLFGRKGSAPGAFGVVSGIAVDSRGNLFVTDRLRSMVLVFDQQHRFVTEFGGYGEEPGQLIRPDQVVVTPSGQAYVTEMRNRGVSVFDVAAKN